MFGALKPDFQRLAIVVNYVGELSTEKNTCGIARFPCDSTAFLFLFGLGIFSQYLFLFIFHSAHLYFLCMAALIAIGGQLWWANGFFWQPAMVTCYVTMCILLLFVWQNKISSSALEVYYGVADFSQVLSKLASRGASCKLIQTYLLLVDDGLGSSALNAPLVACIETLLKGQYRVSFNNMRR